ncbi:hypothetical protein HAX54_036806 [Datura stramonium]|uniref:Non-haem dioxygenase N-terminal domain-containing protein n=1 Tax=Datura stramonium TaxID=4076 RepID=A0ABS8RP08_DATST|nr:hypothetical protein [Datura stramonium]
MERSMMMRSVKAVAELPHLKAVPCNFYVDDNYSLPSINTSSDDDSSLIPVIDFSLLSSQDPHQHSKAIQDLAKACQQWGFFMVVNHGIGEKFDEGVDRGDK